jgi:hypothetical protein
MKKHFSRLFCLVLVAQLIGQTSFAGQESIGEPHTVWKKRSISVCWGKYQNISESVASESMNSIGLIKMEVMKYLSHFDSKLKIAVKQIVQKEYNDDRIGITFTGWKECDDSANADVIIFAIKDTALGKLNNFLTSDLPYGQATIGEAGKSSAKAGYYKPRTHLKPFVFIRQVDISEGFVISPLDALRLTTLHEFGHLLGLRHEHARDEAVKDVNCHVTGTSVASPVGEDVDPSTKFYGVYDPNSIMNYCHIRMLKKKVGLKFQTVQDRTLVNLLLGPWLYTDKEVNFIDSQLVRKSPSMINGITDYSVKVGLSQGDVHTLRCMYNFYAEEDAAKICRPSFDPLK